VLRDQYCGRGIVLTLAEPFLDRLALAQNHALRLLVRQGGAVADDHGLVRDDYVKVFLFVSCEGVVSLTMM
jgi:hypothetical protein